MPFRKSIPRIEIIKSKLFTKRRFAFKKAFHGFLKKKGKI